MEMEPVDLMRTSRENSATMAWKIIFPIQEELFPWQEPRIPDSGSSQFFIVQADSTFLDGDYAGFGHVTEGMDIVDKICEDAKPTDNNGTIPADQQPVIETVKITD